MLGYRLQLFRLAVVGSLLPLAGCDLTGPAVRKPEPTTIGRPGRLVDVKRCALTVAILTGARDDRVLSEVAWQTADEQVIAPELRQALNTNGVRVGRISGEPPMEIQALLKQGPPNPPCTSTIVNPAGQSTLIDATQAPPRPSINLLLSQPGAGVKGKPYEQAKGYLRVTPSYEGQGSVALRIVPEVHHGPVERRYGQLPDGGIAAPAEFQVTEKQREDTFRELAASIALEPGQVVVLGCKPEQSSTLGGLLFQKYEGESDRMLQCVVLIWASRAETAASAASGDILHMPPALWPPQDATAAAQPNATAAK